LADVVAEFPAWEPLELQAETSANAMAAIAASVALRTAGRRLLRVRLPLLLMVLSYLIG